MIVANIVFALLLVLNFWKQKPVRISTRSLFALIAMIAVPLGSMIAIQCHTPMRSAFAMAKNGFSNAILDGQRGDRCGVYSITELSTRSGMTLIYVNGTRDSRDACGFLYSPISDCEVTRETTGLDRSSFLVLGDGWYCFYSTYNWYKLEPS